MFKDKNRPEEALMIKLWNAGYTAQQVADKCGLQSRNVVIGRVHRLLERGDLRVTRAKAEPVVRPEGPRLRPTKAVKRETEAIITHPVAPDRSHVVSLLNASSTQCRYILGEPSEMLCCGAKTDFLSPWCDFHRRRVYTKTPGTAEDRAKALSAARTSASMRQFGG